MSFKILAVTAPGLEPIAQRELRALGVTGARAIEGGVSFRGDARAIMTANLWLRTASRVVVRLGEFHASEFHELERNARRLPWTLVLSAGARVRVRVTCKKSRLIHSDAVAQRIADAILRATQGGVSLARGDEDPGDDDPLKDRGEAPGAAQLFIVRLMRDVCTVSADTSGDLLHLRGYRRDVAKAPLRETLAAAMLLASDWDATAPLADPLCGSGTIAIEGALIARNMAPGRRRDFAFTSWPGFDHASWSELLEAADAAAHATAPAPVLASDRDAGAAAASAANAKRAGVGADIDIACRSLSSLVLPPGPGWIVTNPPYGVRLGETGTLRNLYAQLGNVARRVAPGWVLAMLTADRGLERQVRAPFQKALETTNGGIRVRLVRARMPTPG